MHRRPSLTQRDGLFSTTRYILYGNRVRVIHTSPLVREDQYIPLTAVDPSPSVVRQPDVRVALMGLGLLVPGFAGAAGWPEPLGMGATAAGIGLILLGLVMIGTRAWPGRTYVRHGAVQMLADAPDASTFRHFESRLVDATRRQIVGQDGDDVLPISVASEIRRLADHRDSGHLPREVFDRQKQQLIDSIRDYVP
ncbi:MAG: hypothetical protein ACYTCU_11720 [Planctomycetota bacterium]|jgi:hypothetical protein